MLAKFFIDRPVFACVLSILIVIAGGAAAFFLPIEQYPSIVPPTIRINAVYPGADAETVSRSVAAPIEQQLSGAKGLLYYRSQSTNDGTLTITATFEVGTNQDIAAVEIQNRLSIATPRLPQEVTRQGITVTKASSAMLAVIALRSDNPQYDDVFLSNYATINLLDSIKRVKGIGDAQVFGAKDYAMRLWINPEKLAHNNLTVSDVAAAVREQNAVFPAGSIGQRPHAEGAITASAITSGRLVEPAQYNNILLRANPDGSNVRVGDVARAEMGSASYSQFGRLNGRATAFILVNLQVGANALEAAKNLEETMNTLQKTFPQGVDWKDPYNTAPYIDLSINEVIKTLVEAVGLVILVVFLFLGSWRATLIPLLAVPVAIIGTFAGLAALGFTINTLTLFGLVLAIGIVVDDAIVVVENVERLMHDEHLNPRDATVKAMQQVTGPVIAIVLVLTAVFVPVAFLGGLTGQLYRQFAITIAVSVIISGIVALTLSPALCRILLKPNHNKFVFFRWFDALFAHLTDSFTYGVRQMIRFSLVSFLVFAALLFATYKLNKLVPTSLVPDEDQGFLVTIVQLPDGASLQRTDAVMKQVEEFYGQHPAVQNVVALGGFDFTTGATTSSATFFIGLKPFDQRHAPGMHVADVARAANMHFASNPDAMIFSINLPAIPGLGDRAGFEFEIQSKGDASIPQLAAVTDKFVGAALSTGQIEYPLTTLKVRQPQLFLDLDRDLAKTRSVPINEVFDTLQAYLGSLYINDFEKFGRIWRVQLQADAPFRKSPADIDRFLVRNTHHQMVPLAGLLNSKFIAGPNAVTRFNGFPSVKVSGTPARGVSSGDALQLINSLAQSTLPVGYSHEFSGASYQEIKAGNSAPYVLAFGLVVVFLVLAALYEKWTLPIAVLLTVPIAAMGALLAIFFRELSQDIYFQVGLLTLVGLSAKNAILIVEFCVARHNEGVPITQAAIEAARLRFRPIVMTSLAFILGVAPLAISSGAGAAARHSIGTGVIGGMLAATFLAIFFVPVFFVTITKLTEFLHPSSKPQPKILPQETPPKI